MKLKNKTVGIWGFGAVGKSVSETLSNRGSTIVVYDDSAKSLAQCPYKKARRLEPFFDQVEYLLPSPGIDTRPYRHLYQGTWLNELDLFQEFFRKPIIAITGSVGKTSVAHLLTQALQYHGWRVEAAGNIGTPLFETLQRQENLDALVVELSSFQLEFAQKFAPDVAIWTNLYPNHLDRHSNMEQYFLAKCNILKNQRNRQHAIVSQALKSLISAENLEASITYFDHEQQHSKVSSNIVGSNWIAVQLALKALNLPAPKELEMPALEHRFETVASIGNVDFINDSKSTTPASTLSALDRLIHKKVILLVGGLSKGIDRSELIKKIHRSSTEIIFFGREAESLQSLAGKYSVPSKCYSTLSQALNHLFLRKFSNETILLSPAGSSFDEFKNYIERGNFFKKAILAKFKNSLK